MNEPVQAVVLHHCTVPAERVFDARLDVTPLDRGCEVKVTHEMSAEWAAFVDKAAGAGTKMLEALDRMFAGPARG